MSLPREIQIKFDTMAAKPNTMHDICVHIANGGDMISLTEAWGIPYGYVLEWINADDLRHDQYQRAIKAQMHWAIERVLKELKTMALLDFAGAYGDNGALLHPKQMPENIRRAIAGIEVTEEFEGVGADRELIGYTKKVKFWDKPKALEMIGRKFAMFVDRMRVDVDNKSLEDLIHESWNAKVIDAEISPSLPQGDSAPPTPGESPPPSTDKGSIAENSPKSDKSSTVSPSQPDIEQKYNELIFAVGNKYKDESRHETALRYIREAERVTDSQPPQVDEPDMIP